MCACDTFATRQQVLQQGAADIAVLLLNTAFRTGHERAPAVLQSTAFVILCRQQQQ